VDDRRDYFRVDTELLIHYKSVAPDDVDSAIERFRHGVPDKFTLGAHFAAASRQLETVHKRVAAENPDVAHYLASLDHKLDILARLLLAGEHAERGAQLVQADLSATGVGFEADHDFASGDLLELRIVLMPSHIGLELIGRVVRSSSIGDNRFRVATEFEFIRDADQEQIIEHTLALQTAMLRERARSKD
jgi:hypothetical protein